MLKCESLHNYLILLILDEVFIVGLAPIPLMGAYCASKSALVTISEVWRYELKMWGIKVATIIPSGYKTGKCMQYYTIHIPIE